MKYSYLCFQRVVEGRKLFAKFRESQVGPQWRNGVYFEDKGYEAGVYYLNAKMGLEGFI